MVSSYHVKGAHSQHDRLLPKLIDHMAEVMCVNNCKVTLSHPSPSPPAHCTLWKEATLAHSFVFPLFIF